MLRPVLLLVALGLAAAPLRAQDSGQGWGPWHALGPFDHPLGAGNIDAPQAVERELRQMGAGESGPDLEQAYRGKEGARIRWRSLRGAAAESRAVDVGAIGFAQALEEPEGVEAWTSNVVAYLYRTITVPEAREVAVNLGSDDGVRVWLNGGLILDRSTPRGLNVKDHNLVLHLEAGTNHLLVKVSQGGGNWGFQIAPWSKIPQAAINAAIDRGVAWLLDHQLVDGSWGWRDEYRGGHTAFVVYTLLKCGVREGHPAIRRALAYVEAHPAGYTYSLACEVLALSALSGGEHRVWLADRLDELVDVQGSSGLFAYPVHPGGSVLPEDLSNTLYAALACRAAQRAGLDVSPRVWTRFAKGTLRCLERERRVRSATGEGKVAVSGFGYRPTNAATLSMTTAGVSVLAMVEQALGADLSPGMQRQFEAARSGALAWIDANMTWVKNAPNASHHYFAVYGMERVGSLLGVEMLGGCNWYWDGAEYLVQQQAEDGCWKPEHEYVDTLLALLFLERATAPSSGKEPAREDSYAAEGAEDAVHLRAVGDTPITIWISGFSAATRDSLRWPGDRGRGLRVERVEYLARRIPAGEDAPEEEDPEDGAAEETVPSEDEVAGEAAAEDAPVRELIATVDADPAQPAGTQRFELRHTFPARGRWGLVARVHVLAPPAESGLQPTPMVLESAELSVKIDEILRPAQLGYPSDGTRNLLRKRKITAKASSHTGGQQPPRIADGKQGTRWHSAVGDERPWIRLALDRPVTTSRLLLSHAWPRPTHVDAPSPARVEIVFNGKETRELVMDPDPLMKTVLELEKPIRVRTLELRIVESANRAIGTDAVGFAEVELQ